MRLVVAASYGSVGDIEIMWTLICLTGFSFAVYNLRCALLDRRAQIQSGRNGNLKIIAQTAVFLEVLRVAIQTVFLAIGVVAMLLPQPQVHVQPLRYTIAGALIQWGIIFASIAVTVQAVLNTRLREYLAR